MSVSDSAMPLDEHALRERISDLERELVTMRHRLNRVEELDRVYSDVAMAVSHELRTPLTLISGYAQQLLLRWNLTDENRRFAMVEKINISSRRLSRLIDDMLLMTDAEVGDLSMQVRSVDLREIVDNAMVEVRDRFRDALPTIEIDGHDVRILADGFRMEQALICLIDNAVKHSPPGGVITLSWHDVGSETVMMVRDQGPGIASGDMERLFRRFGRLQQTIGQSHGGVGLGLYIARRLVEAMDGRIWAESERGAGSAFCIAVPRSQEQR